MNEEQKKSRNKRQNTWQKENTDRLNFTMPKGRKAEIISLAKAAGTNASEWINSAITEKMLNNPEEVQKKEDSIKSFVKSIPDLEAYARSAGMTAEEYINTAVMEKMQRQDAEYSEEITREVVKD